MGHQLAAALPEACLVSLPLEPPWRVIRVKTTRELVVRDALLRQGIQAYVPCGIQSKQWSDRFRKCESPFFPSYVLTRYERNDLDFILTVPFLLGILRFCDADALIENYEIERVRIMAASHQPIDVVDRLPAGAPVRVTSGALEGLTGQFEEQGGKGKIWTTLPLFNRSCRTSVDRSMVEPIKPAMV